jgi:hypothetical protein
MQIINLMQKHNLHKNLMKNNYGFKILIYIDL